MQHEASEKTCKYRAAEMLKRIRNDLLQQQHSEPQQNAVWGLLGILCCILAFPFGGALLVLYYSLEEWRMNALVTAQEALAKGTPAHKLTHMEKGVLQEYNNAHRRMLAANAIAPNKPTSSTDPEERSSGDAKQVGCDVAAFLLLPTDMS